MTQLQSSMVTTYQIYANWWASIPRFDLFQDKLLTKSFHANENVLYSWASVVVAIYVCFFFVAFIWLRSSASGYNKWIHDFVFSCAHKVQNSMRFKGKIYLVFFLFVFIWTECKWFAFDLVFRRMKHIMVKWIKWELMF